MSQSLKTVQPPPDPILVLHPALFALYPVLGLYATNMHVTPFGTVLRTALMAMGAAMALWLVLALILRRVHKAGLLASLVVLSCVSGWSMLEALMALGAALTDWIPTPLIYTVFAVLGLGLTGFAAWRLRGDRVRAAERAALLAAACLAVPVLAEFVLYGGMNRFAAWSVSSYLVLVAAAAVVLVMHRGDCRAMARGANWFGVLLLALYGLQIAVQATRQERFEVPPLEATPAAVPADSRPDIYCVALSGYPGMDRLRDLTGYNPMYFEETMRGLGFESARDAVGNYPQADRSLAAALNLDYTEAITPGTSAASLSRLYDHNRLFRFLSAQGYEVTVFSPGLDAWEPRRSVDHAVRPPGVLSEFDLVFLNQTLLSRIMPSWYNYKYGNPAYWRFSARRERILFALDGMPELASEKQEKPRFVFSYLTIPSPPFLFTRNGDRARPYGPGAPDYENAFLGPEEAFVNALDDQIHYTNRRIEELAGRMCRESARPAVVVVFSTGGLGLAPDEAASASTLVMARFPENMPGQDSLYDSMSLVNLFRVVLNRSLGTSLPLLEDRVMPAE
jgi:hypothetical protein